MAKAKDKVAELDTLRAKKESLEKELQALVAEEKAITEKRLREIATSLIAEVRTIGYNGYIYEEEVKEGDNALTVKVMPKRVGSIAKHGREVIVTKDDQSQKYPSCADACRALGLEIGKSNARLVLERHGYTVTNSTAITVN